MGFGHRVYRAEDPRARVLRRTRKRDRLAPLRGRRGARGGRAGRAQGAQARPRAGHQRRVLVGGRARLRRGARRTCSRRMFTLRARGRLVGAHPGAEARGPADPADGEVRRAGAAAARRRALTRAGTIPRSRSTAHFISGRQDEAFDARARDRRRGAARGVRSGRGRAAAVRPVRARDVPRPGADAAAGDRDQPRRPRRHHRGVRRATCRPSTPRRRGSSPARWRSRSRAATCATRSSATRTG